MIKMQPPSLGTSLAFVMAVPYQIVCEAILTTAALASGSASSPDAKVTAPQASAPAGQSSHLRREIGRSALQEEKKRGFINFGRVPRT